MSVPAFVQENGAVGAWQSLSVGTTAVSLAAFGANIGAGSTVIVILAKTNTAARTYSVSDDGFATTYSSTTISSSAANRGIQIFYKTGHAGGAVTIQVRHASGTNQTVSLKAIEIQASLLDRSASFTGAIAAVATNGGYAMAGAGELDTTFGDVFVVGAVLTDGTSAFNGPTSGYSQLAHTAGVAYAQYKTSVSALADDRAIVPETGTDRDHAGQIIAFYSPATGGGIVPHAMHHRRLAA